MEPGLFIPSGCFFVGIGCCFFWKRLPAGGENRKGAGPPPPPRGESRFKMDRFFRIVGPQDPIYQAIGGSRPGIENGGKCFTAESRFIPERGRSDELGGGVSLDNLDPTTGPWLSVNPRRPGREPYLGGKRLKDGWTGEGFRAVFFKPKESAARARFRVGRKRFFVAQSGEWFFSVKKKKNYRGGGRPADRQWVGAVEDDWKKKSNPRKNHLALWVQSRFYG